MRNQYTIILAMDTHTNNMQVHIVLFFINVQICHIPAIFQFLLRFFFTKAANYYFKHHF